MTNIQMIIIYKKEEDTHHDDDHHPDDHHDHHKKEEDADHDDDDADDHHEDDEDHDDPGGVFYHSHLTMTRKLVEFYLQHPNDSNAINDDNGDDKTKNHHTLQLVLYCCYPVYLLSGR